jgi:hypothetical protein
MPTNTPLDACLWPPKWNVRHVGDVVEGLVEDEGVKLVKQLCAHAVLDVPVAQHVRALEGRTPNAVHLVSAQSLGRRTLGHWRTAT